MARPQATLFGQDAYPSLEGKAAALLHSIVRNHALSDGNKRLGWLACTVSLHLNGVTLTVEDDTAYDLVHQITGNPGNPVVAGASARRPPSQASWVSQPFSSSALPS